MFELVEYFIGPQTWAKYNAEAHRAQAEAAGLDVVDLRMELLRAEFFDIGAVVYFLRKGLTVPGFTVERYRRRLAELHERIEAEGPFVTHTDAGPRRSPKTRRAPLLIPRPHPWRNTSSACCRSGGYGLTISSCWPAAGCANESDRACSHCRCSLRLSASFGLAP